VTAYVLKDESLRKRLYIYYRAKLILAWRMIVLLLLLPFFVLSAVVTWSDLGDYYSATDRHQHFPTWSVVLLVISTLAIVLYVIYFIAERIWKDIIEPPTVIAGTVINRNIREDDVSLTFVVAGQGGSSLHINVMEAYHLSHSGKLKPADSKS
jgi:uncharacterized membrane protein